MHFQQINFSILLCSPNDIENIYLLQIAFGVIPRISVIETETNRLKKFESEKLLANNSITTVTDAH